MKFQFSGKNKRYFEAGVHILVWGIFFNLPLLSSSHPPESRLEYLLRLTPSLASAVVFYINYLVLVPKFIFPKKITLFVLTNIVVYIICIFLMEQSREWAFELGLMKKVPGMDIEIFSRFFFSFVATTGIAVAFLISSRWFKSESIRKDLQQENLKSELLNLKNQLNPHFFFNTLNTIYGLIIQDQEKAQGAVHRLSKLMRYLLYDSNEEFVPLSKEIDFMHHYIDLMKLRSAANMTIEYHFPKAPGNLQVPPLLFISLIENGFKHGSSSDKPSSILIEMTLEGEDIHFKMKNTDYAKDDMDRSGSGIGLQNVVKRLELLYPGKHQFTFKSEGGIFESDIILKP
jgi:hypothetical protein